MIKNNTTLIRIGHIWKRQDNMCSNRVTANIQTTHCASPNNIVLSGYSDKNLKSLQFLRSKASMFLCPSPSSDHEHGMHNVFPYFFFNSIPTRMCIIFVLCERFVVCPCVFVHIALLLGNWPHFISYFPFGFYSSLSIVNVCFYIAHYLYMHLSTRFNRKRFRCWNGYYLCSLTHFCASSI